jgi:hypothetical protein
VRVGLVGCVKEKLEYAAPAKELYTSPLFVGRRRWVERTCDRWFILSALHGLVAPDQRLEPYDETLRTASKAARQVWSERVLEDLSHRMGHLASHVFEVHAGKDYRGFGLVAGLKSAGASVEVPAAGLPLGRQLALYRAGKAIGPAPHHPTKPAVQDRQGAEADVQSPAASDEAARVWAAIERHAGETFHQVRGQAFTYRLQGAGIVPSTTRYRIPRSAFDRALERLPVTGPGELNDLRGPSYLYAILMDPRIRRGAPDNPCAD